MRRPRAEQPPGQLDILLRAQGITHRMALGGEEGKAHGTADEDRVGDLAEALDHRDLVADLGPSEDRNQRPLRRLEQPGQGPHLTFEQPPGRPLGNEVGDPLGRRVRSVGRTEGIVDVDVGEISEGGGQPGVVLVSPGS